VQADNYHKNNRPSPSISSPAASPRKISKSAEKERELNAHSSGRGREVRICWARLHESRGGIGKCLDRAVGHGGTWGKSDPPKDRNCHRQTHVANWQSGPSKCRRFKNGGKRGIKRANVKCPTPEAHVIQGRVDGEVGVSGSGSPYLRSTDPWQYDLHMNRRRRRVEGTAGKSKKCRSAASREE